MNNIQLYKTNLFLGGQLKLDMIIDNNSNSLYVSNMYLSPISNNIPYIYKSDENLLKNKHQDNVKRFFNTIQGHFYNEELQSEFNHNWPLINIDTNNEVYSNTFNMGCKRTKHYNAYKKQFEFFCPIWIEKLKENSVLTFTINIKSEDDNTKNVATKKLIIDLSNKNDRFSNYLYNYFKDAGLFDGNDDLINIKLNKQFATISGLDVSNGIFLTKNIDSIVNNITFRERPLMEVDNMLIESFKNNTMICKQLLNFNLCFDLSDIFSISLFNLMLGKNVSISVDVDIDGTPLDKKDFYSNYDYINRTSNYDLKDDISNVLSYLHDNECVDLINKNKFAQNIIHWSLSDNNDYIFNVYNGFSGLYIDDVYGKEIYYENNHQYGNAPNVLSTKLNEKQNTTNWINIRTINNSFKEFYKYIIQTNKYKTDGILIENGVKYINNIKYNITDVNKEYYALCLHVSSKVISMIYESFDLLDISDRLKILILEDLMLLISDDINEFSFKNMYDMCTIYLLNNKNEYIENLLKVMNSKIDPELILLNTSLYWNTCDGPSKDIKEVTYFKNNETSEYVIRYDGKLKPTFVEANNYLYYKDTIIPNKTDKYYKKYSNSGYEPLFPSINYCAIKTIQNWEYDIPQKELINTTEYSWFNNNACIVILPKLQFNIEVKHISKIENITTTIDEFVYNKLKETYAEVDKNKILYIKSLYDITYDWNYISNDIDNYIYTITMKLK